MAPTTVRIRSSPPSPPFTVAEFAELVSAALNPPRQPPPSSPSTWSAFPDMRLVKMALEEHGMDDSIQGHSSIPNANQTGDARRNLNPRRCAFEMERVGFEFEGDGMGVAAVSDDGEDEGKWGTMSASSPTMASAKAEAGITLDPVSVKKTGRRRPLDQKSFNLNHIPNPSPGVPNPHLYLHPHTPSRPRSRSTNSGIPSVVVTPPSSHSQTQPRKQAQERARRRSTITFAPLPLPPHSPKLSPFPFSESRSNSTSKKATKKDNHPESENTDPMILFAPPPVLSNNNSTNNRNDYGNSTSTPYPYPTPIISATMSTVDLGINCLTSLNVAVGGSPNVSVGVTPSAYGTVGKERSRSKSQSKSKSRSVSRSRSGMKEKEKKTPGLGSASLSPSPLPQRGRSASASASGPYNRMSAPNLPFPSSSRLSAPPSSASPPQLLSPPGSGSNPLALRVFAKIKKQLSRNSINVNTINLNTHDISSSASCPNTPISGAFHTNVGMDHKSEEANSPLPLEYRYEYEFDFPYEFGVMPGRPSASETEGEMTGTALSPPQAQVRERARSVVSSFTSTSTSTSVSALVSTPVGKVGKGKVSPSRYPTTNTDLGFTSFAALSAGNDIVSSSVGKSLSSVGDRRIHGEIAVAENEEEDDASMSTSRGGRRRGRVGRALPGSSDDDEGLYYSSSSASPMKPTIIPPFMGSPASITSSASSYSCESAPFSFSFFPSPAGVASSLHAPRQQQQHQQEEDEMFFSGHPYAHPELRSSMGSSPSFLSGVSGFDGNVKDGVVRSGSGSGSSSDSGSNAVSQEDVMGGLDSDSTSFIGSSCSFFVRMRARTSGPTVGVLDALGGVRGRNARAVPNNKRVSQQQGQQHVQQHQPQQNEEEIEPFVPFVPLIIQLERERMKEREREKKSQMKASSSSSTSTSSSGSRPGTGSRSRSSTTPTPTPLVRTIPISTPTPTPSITTPTTKGGLLPSEGRRARTSSMRTGSGTARGSPPPPLLSPSTPYRLSASSDVSNVSFESDGPVTPRTPVFVVVSEHDRETGKEEDNGKSRNIVVQSLSPTNETTTIRTSTPTPTIVNSAVANASPPSASRSRPKQSVVPNGTSPPLRPLPLVPNPNLEQEKTATKPTIPRRSSRRGRCESSVVPSSGQGVQQQPQPNTNEVVDEPEHRLSSSSATSSCILGSIVSSSSSSSLSSSSSPVPGYERRPRFPSSPLSFSSISDSDNSEVVYETPMQTPTLSVFPSSSAQAAAVEAEAARVLVANTRANAASLSFTKTTGQIGIGRQIVRRGERTGGDWTLSLGAGEEKERESAGRIKRCASNIGGKAMMNGRMDAERMRTKSESALRSVARGAGARAAVASAVGGGTEDWTLSMNLPMPGSIGRMGVLGKQEVPDVGKVASTAEAITLTVPRVVSVGSGIEDAVMDEEDLARLELEQLEVDESDHPVRESRVGLRNTKSCGILLSGAAGDLRSRAGKGTSVARMSSASQLIGTSTTIAKNANTTTSKASTSRSTSTSTQKPNSISKASTIGSRHAPKARRPTLPLTTLLPLPLPLPSPRPNATLRPSSIISSNSCSGSTSDPELTPTPVVDSPSNSFPFPDAMTRNRLQPRTQTPDVQESSDSMCSVDYYSARSSFALEA